MDILIRLMAGLGFIFIGTHFLTVNMKQAAGPRFRSIVRKATVSPLHAAIVGIGSGATIQSTNAVTFIVVGLVSAGAITVQAGMPIVTWSYAGTTLRLLLVSIDASLLTYALVAAVGIAYFLEYHKSASGYLVNALMGLSLLMVGVDLTGDAAKPLSQSQTVRDLLVIADHFYYWGFIAGAVFATFMQGMTVSIIAVALAQSGLLGVEQTMLIVVGANVGSGLMSWMQGATLTGTERQLSVYQVLLKAVGALILLPLLSLEHYAGVPTVAALVGAITAEVAFQVTLVHWLYQIVAALAASVLNRPLYALVNRLSPPSVEEELSRPVHLYVPPADEPLAMAEQAEREQRRLLRRLPDFLAGLRPEEIGEQKPPAMPVLQRSGKALAGEIRGFLTELMATTPHGKANDRLYQLWNGNEVLLALQDELAAFVKAMPPRGRAPAADRLIINLTEGLHALLDVVALEFDGDEPADPETLARLTADRSMMMLRVRDGIATLDPPLPADIRLALWKSTDRFEHIGWLLRRYAWSLGTMSEVYPDTIVRVAGEDETLNEQVLPQGA